MKQLIKYKKYLPFILVVLLGLTPLIWFLGKGGALINGVDTNFPLEPLIWLKRRFFVWNGITNAGSDFSSSTAGLFFHFVQVIPYLLGFGLQQVQIVSFVFWFLLIVFSSYFLARIILPGRSFIQLLFVVLYSFNIYLFNSWENVKVANLSLVAAVPMALSVLILLKNKKLSYNKAAFYSVLIGIIVSGTGINPSYFISFFFVLVLFLLGEIITDLRKESIVGRIKDLLFVGTFIVLVNSFWILPTINFVLGSVSPDESIDIIGFTNWVDSLSKNTSLFNILRLQGAWDWYAFDGVSGLPLYIPYALNYFYRFPFIVFSLLIPGFAIFSLLLKDKKKNGLYLFFALMLVIGVFLGTGTHFPTGVVFRWLLNRIPFFSLFRSPWYIFTVLLTLSYAGLISLLFYNLKNTFEKKKLKVGEILTHLAVLIFIVGNLLYSYPLITGKIFRPGRYDSFYVEFPDYVFEAGKWASQTEGDRIIGYPDDEIEKFNWGYRGIESVLALTSSRETFFAPLNMPDAPVAILIKQFFQSLKKGQVESAKSLAAKLNIGLLFEKNDQKSLTPALPDKIRDLPAEKFGEWNFYKINDFSDPLPKIYSTHSLFFAYPYKEAVKALEVLKTKDLLVDPADTIVDSIPEVSRFTGKVVFAENSQAKDFSNFQNSPSRLSNRLLSRDLSKVDFTFNIQEEGIYQPVLERYKLEDFGIDLAREFKVEIDGKESVWAINKSSDSYVYFNPQKFSSGLHNISINLENTNLIEGEQDFVEDGEGEFNILTDENGNYLNILNKSKHDISANLLISSFDPMIPYFIQFEYKQIYGNNASILTIQGTQSAQIKTQVERLPNYPEWNVFSYYYEPVKTDSKMSVLLVAPFTEDPLGTKVCYDDLVVRKVFVNDLLLIKGATEFLSSPEIEFEKISPVLYKAKISEAETPHIIVFLENYSDQWQLIPFNKNGNKLEIKSLHFSANLYANAWYIEGSPEEYEVKIYYKPQRLFNIGMIISGGTFILGITFLLKGKYERKT